MIFTNSYLLEYLIQVVIQEIVWTSRCIQNVQVQVHRGRQVGPLRQEQPRRTPRPVPRQRGRRRVLHVPRRRAPDRHTSLRLPAQQPPNAQDHHYRAHPRPRPGARLPEEPQPPSPVTHALRQAWHSHPTPSSPPTLGDHGHSASSRSHEDATRRNGPGVADIFFLIHLTLRLGEQGRFQAGRIDYDISLSTFSPLSLQFLSTFYTPSLHIFLTPSEYHLPPFPSPCCRCNG